jgi:hypothetical protein
VQPGQAQITANVANVTSSPVTFTACPVQSISLLDVSGFNNAVFGATGQTVGLSPTAIDTAGQSLSNVTFTYSSSQPAAVKAGATLTSVDAGESTIVASCTPTNSCNTGLYPVYSTAPYLTTLSGASAQTSVYAASTNSNLLEVISSNALGNFVPNTVLSPPSPVTLPNNPNSMLVNSTGTTIVLGADPTAGNSVAMLVDISSASITKLGFNGAVLAISPDGNTAVFADTVNLRFYNIASASFSHSSFPANVSTGGNFPSNPTTAAFSADSFRGYVVTPNQPTGTTDLGMWSACTTCAPKLSAFRASHAGATSVDFLNQGSFAYVGTCHGAPLACSSGLGTLNPYAGCSDATNASGVTVGPTITTTSTPIVVRSLPNGSSMLAVDNVNLYIASLQVSPQTTVPAPCYPVLSSSSPTTVPLPTPPGGFTPAQMLVTPDSTTAFLLGSNTIGNSVLYEYNISTNTFTPITLTNNPTQIFFGGTTLDSTILYVGANDNPGGTSPGGAVHVIAVGSMTEVAAPIAVPFIPNLVAVRPL